VTTVECKTLYLSEPDAGDPRKRRKGNRLSITKVEPQPWQRILKLLGEAACRHPASCIKPAKLLAFQY
jgi:predicted RNA-binding protein with PUA-like domain